MYKKTFLEEKPRISIVFLLSLFFVIAISPYLDIVFSDLFFDDYQGFFLKDKWYFSIINKGLPELLVLIAVIFGGFWVLGILRGKKWFFGIDSKKTLLVSGSMFLGPLLIVNGIFKTLWGRARPMDILEFGGDKLFSPAMVISNQCTRDCSFVSGHTAVAFWTLSLALLFPKKYRNMAVTIAFLFGVFVGMVRIVQGYHYFSDVLFSAVINIYIIWYINKSLLKDS